MEWTIPEIVQNIEHREVRLKEKKSEVGRLKPEGRKFQAHISNPFKNNLRMRLENNGVEPPKSKGE